MPCGVFLDPFVVWCSAFLRSVHDNSSCGKDREEWLPQ